MILVLVAVGLNSRSVVWEHEWVCSGFHVQSSKGGGGAGLTAEEQRNEVPQRTLSVLYSQRRCASAVNVFTAVVKERVRRISFLFLYQFLLMKVHSQFLMFFLHHLINEVHDHNGDDCRSGNDISQ
jgi:hypothetical protein